MNKNIHRLLCLYFIDLEPFISLFYTNMFSNKSLFIYLWRYNYKFKIKI